MYWCLSRNDKKVTDFRKEMSVLRMLVFIWCLCLLLRGYTGAGGIVGPPTCVGGREGGGGCPAIHYPTKSRNPGQKV